MWIHSCTNQCWSSSSAKLRAINRVATKPMRIPLSQVDDERTDNGKNTSTSLEKFPLDPLKSAFDETWRRMSFPEIICQSKKRMTSSSGSSGNSDPRLHGVDVSTLAFNSNAVFGGNKDLTSSIPSPICRHLRKGKDISCVQPSLKKKLTRGDPSTVTDFLSFPHLQNKKEEIDKRN